MERNKNHRDTLFLNYKATNFSKTTFYYPKHLSSIASYYSQKYFIFYKISGKRKYYKELISYE